MQGDIVLSYRRIGETYTGVLQVPETEDSRVVFENKTYSEIMLETYRWLVQYPDAGLVIQRTEREGLMPIQLAPDMLELLRADPVRYIRMHSIAPRTIDLRSGSKRTSALVAGEKYDIPKTTGLRAGCDTMAAAFGETIYLRMNNKLIEHPATGRWVSFVEVERFIGTHNVELLITNDERGAGWATTPLKDLLATAASKFYLPREWNTHGSWITREQLNEMCEHFIDEKGVLLCRSEVPIVPSPQG